MPSQAHDPGRSAADEDAVAADGPLELTHAQMNAAYDTGQAVPFAQGIPWLARYADAWWVAYESGWLRVIDQPTSDSLDRRAAQLTSTDTQAARDAAIRGALSAPSADPPPAR